MREYRPSSAQKQEHQLNTSNLHTHTQLYNSRNKRSTDQACYTSLGDLYPTKMHQEVWKQGPWSCIEWNEATTWLRVLQTNQRQGHDKIREPQSNWISTLASGKKMEELKQGTALMANHNVVGQWRWLKSYCQHRVDTDHISNWC